MLGRGEGFEDVKPPSPISHLMICCIRVFSKRIFWISSFKKKADFFQFKKLSQCKRSDLSKLGKHQTEKKTFQAKPNILALPRTIACTGMGYFVISFLFHFTRNCLLNPCSGLAWSNSHTQDVPFGHQATFSIHFSSKMVLHQ